MLSKGIKIVNGMVRNTMDQEEPVNLDANLEDADWTKQTWDLPTIGSEEFRKYLESTGQTLEDFKHLPVYKNLMAKLFVDNKGNATIVYE